MDQTDPTPGQDSPDLPPEPPAPDSPDRPSSPSAPETSAAAEQTTVRRSGGGWLFTLLLLALLGGGGYWAWLQWQDQQTQQDRSAEWLGLVDQLQQQNTALSAELQQLRERQRSLDQRLGEFASSTRVLREELLGVGERAAALEDALARLARARREGAQALRLDEIDYVLQLAGERLQLFGDSEAAEHALQLAAASLDTIDDLAFAGVRQTLAQELAALRAAPADPRRRLQAELHALQRQLDGLPAAATAAAVPDPEASKLERLFGSLVSVRRLDRSGAVLTPIERATRLAALRLQLGLAQAALERADAAQWQAALVQAVALFDSLFASDAGSSAAARARLQALQQVDFDADRPQLGASLRELRNLRATRRAASDRAAPVEHPSADQPAPELDRR